MRASLLSGKESTCNAGAAGASGSTPGPGRSPGRGNGNPLQYSCLKNPTDRGACRATVHGVAKSWTQLSNFHFHRTHSIIPHSINNPWVNLLRCCCHLVIQPCSTLCDPKDCSLPGFSVQGISQARILESIAIAFCRGSFRSRERTCISCIGRQVHYC